MQCPVCGKFFVERDVFQKLCSIECFTRAQREKLNYCSPMDFNIYLNGEEVKCDNKHSDDKNAGE